MSGDLSPVPCENVAKWCDECGIFAGHSTSPEGQVCYDCDGWFCDDCMIGFTYCRKCFVIYEKKHPNSTRSEILDILE